MTANHTKCNQKQPEVSTFCKVNVAQSEMQDLKNNFDILKEYEAHKTPVPSYDEWQELSKQRNQFIRDIKDLAYIQEENQQLNKRLLDMMDLLQKSYFYLNAVADKKVKTEHLEQVKTLTVLIDNAIGEK